MFKRGHGRVLVAGALLFTAFEGDALADPTITFRYPSYTPNSVRVSPGQSVTWKGDPGNTFAPVSGHPLQFADPSIPAQADSATSTTRTFTSVGRFAYFCRLHAQFNMTGAVLVSANHLPSAAFSAPSSAPVGAPVSFDASGSSDADPGQSLSYSWDLDGDGGPDASGPTASIAYPNAGTYTAKLTVTDSNAEPGIGPESSSTTRPIVVGGSSGSGSGGGGAANIVPVVSTAPGRDDVVLVELAGSTRHEAIRARGLAVRVTATEPADAVATLTFKRRLIARATASLRAHGARLMRVVLNKRGRALLRRHRSIRAELRVVLADEDATSTTAKRLITLRR